MGKKYLLIVFSLLFFLGSFFSYARISDYLEYADIPDTDKIYYNGQFSGLNSYEVFIDTGNIYYITGNDNKIYNCFKIVGTGYTEKLGEIYFQYEGKGSYVCDDNKLRGYFKLGAGGWGELEDMDLSDGENWKDYLDKTNTNGYYYHNGNGDDTGTGKAWIDGVGFSIWNTVKTELNLQEVFSNIKVYPQIIGTPIADGTEEANIRILLTYNGNPLKNFSVDSVFFAVDNNIDTNIVKNNSNTIAGLTYNGGLVTDEKGYLTGKITSLVGGENLTYKLGIQIGENIIYTTGTASFQYPFTINTNLTGNEITGKILVGVQNKVKLDYSITSVNISDVSFGISGSEINLISPKEYFYVYTGNNIKLDNNYYPIQINYSKFFSGDEMQFNYFLTGSYTITKKSDTYTIKSFKTYSSIGKLYKDGRVNNIEINNDGSYPLADGKSIKWYKIYFKDIHGFPINNITFDYSFEDSYNKFNLNPDSQPYETGFFITDSNSDENIDGGYKIGVISYKPTIETILKGYLSNIKFNGYYPINNSNKSIILSNLAFQSIANLTLENKDLKINEAVDLTVTYSNIYDISNPSYKLTGYIIDCSSCNWVDGQILSSNTTGDKTFTIYITGSIAPSAIIYSGYYNYNLDGSYGTKSVYIKKVKEYSPIIIIQGGDVGIKGIAVSKINLIGGISYIATNSKIIEYKNKLRKLIFEKFTKGQNFDSLPIDLELDLTNDLTKNIYVYNCNNNETIKIHGTYNGKYKLFFLGCNIDITDNIKKINSSDSLELILFQKKPALPDINNTEGRKNLGGNVYIGPSVDTIFANILIDGSILTYKGNNPTEENIFYENRESLTENRKQLYINGKIYSKNTIGGGIQDKNNNFTFLGGKKIAPDETIFQTGAHIVTKAYDIKFFRARLYDDNGKYITGDLSEIIYNKYNCSGDKSTDTHKECYMSLIIEDSNKKFDNY